MDYLDKYVLNNHAWYSFKSRFFSIKGKDYEVIGGISTGKTAHDVDYDIRNVKTGEVRVIPMVELIKRLKDEGSGNSFSKNQTH
jgi:hypothetical protein